VISINRNSVAAGELSSAILAERPGAMCVSIVLCTRNRAAQLCSTLTSLQGIDFPEGWDVDVILVDNGSTDATGELLRSYRLPQARVRVLHEPLPGKSRALNRALAVARGSVILFTDDDVRLPRDWIAGMVHRIVQGQADAVVGEVQLAADLDRPWATELHRSWLAATESIDRNSPERLVGANMAICRHMLEKIGGFDVALGPGALGFGEETLLTRQIKDRGGRVAPAWDVCVEHHPGNARLSRKSYLNAAIKMGQVEAYIAHHWNHRRCLPLVDYLSLGFSWVRLCCLRLGRRVACRRENYATPTELQLQKRLAKLRFCLAERHKLPHYSRGLPD
jgi:glycosyltransferase involved in cell wall biosynthesis